MTPAPVQPSDACGSAEGDQVPTQPPTATVTNKTSEAIQRLMARYYSDPPPDPLDQLFVRHARAGMIVLDAGCGGERGVSTEGPCDRMTIIGMDLDPSVGRNPFCDAALLASVSVVPFADESFDLIHCRWVLEHLADPLQTFREFCRVLKPGGRLLAITPNVYHYATVGAKLTPHAFHRWWWGEHYDPFPTHHRANSRRALKRLAAAAGLSVDGVHAIERPPRFLARIPMAFRVGVLYERVVNRVDSLAWLRQTLVLDAVKPVAP